ncbi:GNAT family N-acetyltransferase [Alienimonas californiensis]|uniref:Acetyltransferase (GNAT) family protein n=1 Tax=Alienimonas californiensis TaxID=2527989 RepID=A0A517P827_9PLAN|nr:GNAT family N-acetyltransferase [Alienimonas californiensis]QDT15531.1 Acetyltransferase (GNAT) family protein [Alienimonas californiensis]
MTDRSPESAAPAFVVAPAGPDDAEAIAEFNVRLAEETESKRLDPATVRAGVAAALADPAKALYFVARPAAGTAGGPASGEPPIGCLMVTWEWSDWRNGAIWWIQSVYVHPDHRGRGAFRRLLDHAAGAAVDAGAVGLRLYAERENHAAHAVYARCGFVEPGYVVFERAPAGATGL